MFSYTENLYASDEGISWNWLACALFAMSISLIPVPNGNPLEFPVIYGADDRQEVPSETENLRAHIWSRSVAMVVDENAISQNSNTEYKFKFFESLNNSMTQSGRPLCLSEPFREQPTFDGICSAFLVGRNKIVTAAHCVNDANCAYVNFVFGVDHQKRNGDLSTIIRRDLYRCKHILKRVKQSGGLDFVVIETDRPIEGRNPLRVRRFGSVRPYESLTLIGNPLGLPTKIAANARVLNNTDPFVFSVNTDSYGGQSGSPVIGETSGLVEGLLVSGESDLEKTSGGCYTSKHCSEDGRFCRGETILRAPVFARYIND